MDCLRSAHGCGMYTAGRRLCSSCGGFCGLMIAVTAGGLLSVWKVAGFKDYKDVYRQILSQAKNQMDLRGQMKTQTREQSRK